MSLDVSLIILPSLLLVKEGVVILHTLSIFLSWHLFGAHACPSVKHREIHPNYAVSVPFF